MSASSWRIMSLGGIDIRIDASWLIIAALVTWSFWGRFTVVHDRGGKAALVMAVTGAALFFGSVLAHELAHAFEARHRGVHVGGITLFLFGGVTESRFDVRRPVDEFALTAVGPFTSFVLGAAFGLVATAADSAGLTAVAEVAGLLGWINIALGTFNLIPGAPLDGGRLLRAAVWRWTGDRRRSIAVAADAGRIIGAALIGLGVAQLVFVPGAFVGGVWLAFIGWFLNRAANAERAHAQLTEALGEVRTEGLVISAAPLDAGTTVASALDRWRTTDAPEVLPVTTGGDALAGALSFEQARGVDAGDVDDTSVGSAMSPVGSLPRSDVDDPPDRVIESMAEGDVIVVVDGDREIGIVTTERLLDAARRAELLEPARRGRP